MTELAEITPSGTWLSGLAFPEGLRWYDGALWFSDVIGGKVLRAQPHETKPECVVDVPGWPSGLGFDREGGVIVAAMLTRIVHRYHDGGLETLADLTHVTTRAINDMVLDQPTGNSYVGAYGASDERGFIVLVRPDGESRVVTEDLGYPNGMLVTAERELVAADTFTGRLVTFPIRDDGHFAPARCAVQLPGRTPDGLCDDAEGGVWIASYRTGEVVRLARDGSLTHRVNIGGGYWATACALGGHDGMTLYISIAETTRRRFVRGDSQGWIVTARVPVPATPADLRPDYDSDIAPAHRRFPWWRRKS